MREPAIGYHQLVSSSL